METFAWDKSLITGLSEVDDQHHQLVDLFNELNEVFFQRQDGDDARLQQVFDRLLTYADTHFRSEEEMMQRIGLDVRHFEPHHHLHGQFVEQVRSMWNMRHSLRQPSENIIGFLTSWLVLHIMGVDQSMARQIRLIEEGHSSALAFDTEERSSDKSMGILLKMVGNLYHVLAEQNRDLQHINERLEQRVRDRTEALQKANQELLQANERLHAFSRIDGLLGIANRKHFDERFQQELARSLRHQQPLAVLMMDVDFFKRYNDSYGHPAGDACLQAVARTVRQSLLRETDFLARYGGEELVALLPDTPGPQALQVAQRINQAVQTLALEHRASEAAPVVTLSIGVTSAVPPGLDAGPGLLEQADMALYEAKRSGRNRAVLN